jgi:peptidoglycan/xylan/chitin deacetylase (PgdA/CDA1 family)
MYRCFSSLLLSLVTRLKRGGIIVNGHTLSRSQAESYVDLLGRWFDFVSLEELPGRLRRSTNRPFCLLTFDDGKRSNLTQIAPVLEARGVPAVFYVTTEPLSTGTCFWFDRHQQLVKQLGFCPDGLELERLKKLPFNKLTERLDRACEEHGLKMDNTSDDVRPMSWDEARDLARRGFTIGAHGVTHAILTNESQARAFAEIESSLAKVTTELRSPCTTFAFPNGNYTPVLAEHALRCGATSVMTTEPTWVNERSPFWRLPRLQLFGESSRQRIELKIALAALDGALANPDGSGRAYCSRSRRNEPRVPSADGTERKRRKIEAPALVK